MNRINIICLGVKDIASSLRFYRNIGFDTPTADDAPPVVFFNNSGSKLELYPIDALAKEVGSEMPDVAAGFTGITLAINMKSEKEVDSFMDLVSKNGGTVVKKPEKVFWGGYSGYFRDIDGYYWEVAYGPMWEYDENDMLIIK